MVNIVDLSSFKIKEFLKMNSVGFFFTPDIQGIKHSNMPSFHLEFEKVSPLEIRIFISVQKLTSFKLLPLQKNIRRTFWPYNFKNIWGVLTNVS